MSVHYPATGIYQSASTTGAQFSHPPVITGSGAQWSDDSDATYAENQSWTDTAGDSHTTVTAADFDPITTPAEFYRFELRAWKPGGTVSDLNNLRLEIRADGAYVNDLLLDPTERAQFNAATSGPTWLPWPLVDDGDPSEATGWESVAYSLGDALSRGITVVLWDTTNADPSPVTSLYIYELRLILSDGPRVGLPPLRQDLCRDDVGRVWPVSSQQASLRRLGGYF